MTIGVGSSEVGAENQSDMSAKIQLHKRSDFHTIKIIGVH